MRKAWPGPLLAAALLVQCGDPSASERTAGASQAACPVTRRTVEEFCHGYALEPCPDYPAMVQRSSRQTSCWTGACRGQPLRYVSWVVNSCCGVEAYFDESGRLVGGVYQDDSVGPDGCAGRSVYGQEIACAREPIERCPR